MSATKTKKDTHKQTQKKSRTEQPWNVVLHNDWNNSMPKVVYVLVRTIPGMNTRRATALRLRSQSGASRRAGRLCQPGSALQAHR